MVFGRHERAVEWLRIWADLGRAPRTIDAYARGLAEYLEVCERDGVDPLVAGRAQVASFVRELSSRPSRLGVNTVALDSGSGLANATLQQRLVPVRLFYDFLVEEGVRSSNPVGRGRYGARRTVGAGGRALVPRLVKMPWIPTDQQWRDVLAVFRDEPIRNRLMLALAYDGALRREELCSLRTDDLDPAHRMMRIRAETTKTRRGRSVPYSATSGALLAAYLQHRGTVSRSRGPLLLSESRRNHAEPLSLDLVEGGAPSRARSRCPAVLDPHHPASLSDRPRPDGLGDAHHRHVRRAPEHGLDVALHPSVGPRAFRQAQPEDGRDPYVADQSAG